jgi:hypothetical protein
MVDPLSAVAGPVAGGGPPGVDVTVVVGHDKSS